MPRPLHIHPVPRCVAIIGAGPAGITAAYQLAKAGIATKVYEASNHIGGFAQTIELWGQKVDLGPHRFFSSDPRVNSLWLEVAKQDYRMVSRLTRIYFDRNFFHYPLKPVNALWNLGPWEAQKCLLSYLKEIGSRSTSQDTFENWVVQRFGRRLFEIFFKSYSEKLWGITCSELDSDFAAQRIKKLSLAEAIKNAFGKSKAQHKTLVDEFAYPLGGTGSIYERMAAEVVRRGGEIHLNQPVKGILSSNFIVKGIELQSGEKIECDHVISSMPLTVMVKTLSKAPTEVLLAAKQLRYRNTTLVYLLIDSDNLFKDNWLYVHSPQLKVGRITNFRNWIPELYGTSPHTILCLEFWSNDEDPIWQEKDTALIERAKFELAKTGLIGNAQILDGAVKKLAKCYPIYARGYQKSLATLIDFLKKFSHLQAIGRYGSFKYNNQDHSLLMGILASENLTSARQHDLWSINTDYEYQESARITETGLVKEAS